MLEYKKDIDRIKLKFDPVYIFFIFKHIKYALSALNKRTSLIKWNLFLFYSTLRYTIAFNFSRGATKWLRWYPWTWNS